MAEPNGHRKRNGHEKYLPARLLQSLGVALLVGAAIFWGVTGRESALIMSSAMSLIFLGAYKGLMDALRGGVSNGMRRNGDAS